MVWNIIYNALWDRLWPVTWPSVPLRVRALHAIGLESGFIIIGVTMVALVLGVSLMQAFMLEIGFMLFLPALHHGLKRSGICCVSGSLRFASSGSPPASNLSSKAPGPVMASAASFLRQKLSPQLIHKCDKSHSLLFRFLV